MSNHEHSHGRSHSGHWPGIRGSASWDGMVTDDDSFDVLYTRSTSSVPGVSDCGAVVTNSEHEFIAEIDRAGDGDEGKNPPAEERSNEV